MRVSTDTHWVTAFREAALRLLARHPGHDDYRSLIHAGPCPQHPHCCVQVVYRVLLRHVVWQTACPVEVAGDVVRNMLPPAECCHAGCETREEPRRAG